MFEKIKNVLQGMDKFTHHGIGAEIAAVVSTVALLQETVMLGHIDFAILGYSLIMGLVAAWFFGVAKETVDEKFEWADVAATVSGAILYDVAALIGYGLGVLSA